ncbi:MAG: RelA/SpoT family protein [Bacteroidetes bacterium 4572_77]|nr:MAG: RelA/SpoT family protein [Bacteroidetes bacterium 4572_77]
MYIIDEEQENKEIVNLYRKIINKRDKKKADKSDVAIIRKAFNMAHDAHSGMRRRSGEPYILHPLNVALICVEQLGLGTKSIVSALLHDVVEDTDITIEQIESSFGEKIAVIVSGLTKIKGLLSKSQVESEQAENFKRLILTLSTDVRVILIKMADRLHNMSTLDAMPHEKQLKIAAETQIIFAPLADRLGLHLMKTELENLSFKYIDPLAHKLISDKLKDGKEKRKKYLRTFITPIRNDIKNNTNLEVSIVQREKSVYSIWKKMQKQQIPFEEVFDLLAIRIIIKDGIVDEKTDCLRVYSIITDHYRPNRKRTRDFISNPKSNSYEALHLTVIEKDNKDAEYVEVQIRTKRMDDIAEKGYAAHWKYKMDVTKVENELDQWLEKAKDLLELNDNNALDFVSDMKTELLVKDILLFTPQNKEISLSQGATPIDFAYAIHTHLGNTCMAAQVNGRIVSLNHKLQTGDKVKIISSDNHHPQEIWLNWAITTKAKNNIKQAIKENKKKNKDAGKTETKRLFSKFNWDYNKDNLLKLIECLSISDELDFFNDIAIGRISETEIKTCLQKDEKSLWKRVLPSFFTKGNNPQTIEKSIGKAIRKNPETLMLDKNATAKDLRYTKATCCNPIEGDDIIGINTGNIEIHRVNCPVALELMTTHGKQIIKTKFNLEGRVIFLAGIEITGNDSHGLVLNITKIISDNYGINMRSIHFVTSENVATGTITLYINNLKSLNKLMQNIKQIKSIEKVERIDSIKDHH